MKRVKLISCILSVILLFVGCVSFTACTETKDLTKVYEDFLYMVFSEKNDNGEEIQYVNLAGLSEQGQKKKTLIVPTTIEGISIRLLTLIDSFGACVGCWESEKLEKVFLKKSFNLGSVFSGCPNLKKVIICTKYSFGSYYSSAKIYVSSVDRTEEIGSNVRSENSRYSNVSFIYNYEGSENDGYYWIDDLDYGSKIELLPENPEREGYLFGGWFKESECVNVWDFETDTLPQEKLLENGEIMYQETRLYAKWNTQNYEY